MTAERRAERLALVTGGAGGIGRAAALALGAGGARVILVDLGGERLAAAAGELRGTGIPVESLALDLADADAAGATLTRALDGRALDVLVASAGVALPEQPFELLALEQWDRLHAVNLRGAFVTARAALPALRRAVPSSIVLVGSTSGLAGHSRAAAYAASKWGLVGFGRSLALELAPEGIRVVTVCPGGTLTPMLASVYDDPSSAAEDVPDGRLASPQDIADAIVFVSSPQAAHVTGTELIVDGGRSAGI